MNKTLRISLGAMTVIYMAIAMSLPMAAYAQSSSYYGNPSKNNPAPTYTPLSPLPTCTKAGCSSTASTTINFSGWIQNTFNFVIFVAAAMAVFMITYGGFVYMTTDSVTGKIEGRKKAVNAVYGLLLVLGSYLILRTIDPRLVAIPSTLVTRLDINYTKADMTFVDQLGKVIAQYHTNTQNALNAIAAGNAQKALDQTTLDNASKKVCDILYSITYSEGAGCDAGQVCAGVPTGNQDLDAACAARAKAANTVATDDQNTALATAIGLATGGAFLEGCSPTGDPSLCDTSKAPSLYVQFSKQVSPDQLSKLQSAWLYEQDVINMTKQAALLYQQANTTLWQSLWNWDAALTYTHLANISVSSQTGAVPAVYNQYQNTIKIINDTATNYINSSNTSPELVTQMKQQQDALIKTVNAMKYH